MIVYGFNEWILEDIQAARELSSFINNHDHDNIVIKKTDLSIEEIDAAVSFLNNPDQQLDDQFDYIKIGFLWGIPKMIERGCKGNEWRAVEALAQLGHSTENVELQLIEKAKRGEDIGEANCFPVFLRIFQMSQPIISKTALLKLLNKGFACFGSIFECTIDINDLLQFDISELREMSYKGGELFYQKSQAAIAIREEHEFRASLEDANRKLELKINKIISQFKKMNDTLRLEKRNAKNLSEVLNSLLT